MGKYLGSTGLTYLWGKIKSIFVTKTELAGHPTGRIYYGTCSTTANTYTKVATVDTFPLDEDDKPLVGTVVAIKYTVTNTYKTEGQTYALNVNNTGAYPMYYNNDAVATSTSANTLVAGYKNRHVFYVFNGTQWVWLSASYDTNTTYSGMTQAEVDAGTGTTARLITPKMLKDNFYTEDEVDTLISNVPTKTSDLINDSGFLEVHNGDATQIVRANGLLSDIYFMPYNSFSSQQNRIYNHLTDNYLAGFNKKAEVNNWVCTRKLYDTNNDFVQDLPMNIFDGNYEHTNSTVIDNTTEIIYLGTEALEDLDSSSPSFTTYGQGYLYVSFFSSFLPASLSARIYIKYNNIGWYSLNFENVNNSIYKAAIPGNAVYPCALEITCIGKSYPNGTTVFGASITQIEWVCTRISMSNSSVITKYPIVQEVFGEFIVPKITIREGSSSQYLKGDGSAEDFSDMMKRTFTNYIAGKYLNMSGQAISDSEWCYEDEYIPVTPSSSITWKYGNANYYSATRCLVCYDANKTRVDYWAANNATGERTITVNGSTHYIRISFHNNTVDANVKANGIVLWKRRDIEGIISIDKKIDTKIGSSDVMSVVKITEAEYNALNTKDSSTLYIITS